MYQHFMRKSRKLNNFRFLDSNQYRRIGFFQRFIMRGCFHCGVKTISFKEEVILLVFIIKLYHIFLMINPICPILFQIFGKLKLTPETCQDISRHVRTCNIQGMSSNLETRSLTVQTGSVQNLAGNLSYCYSVRRFYISTTHVFAHESE